MVRVCDVSSLNMRLPDAFKIVDFLPAKQLCVCLNIISLSYTVHLFRFASNAPNDELIARFAIIFISDSVKHNEIPKGKE